MALGEHAETLTGALFDRRSVEWLRKKHDLWIEKYVGVMPRDGRISCEPRTWAHDLCHRSGLRDRIDSARTSKSGRRGDPALPGLDGVSGPVRLTFLQINDLHGYLEPHAEMVRDAGEWRFATLGGLARIATLFRDAREEAGGAVVALDNGDTFHGTHAAVTSRGQALPPLMNALGLDAMTVHWEFAYGPEGVRQIAGALRYPVLAVNVHSKADDALAFAPYRVLERAGLRIAVIGLACPIVDKTMPPSYSTGLYFTIGNRELPRWIAQARQQERADLVVVLSHLGFPQDVKLARQTTGIDVLVSGHTHNRMEAAIVENGAIIFRSGCHGSFIGRLDVVVNDRRITSYDHRLVPVDARLEEEAAMKRLVDEALQPSRAALGEVVGAVSEPLHRYAMLGAPMDDVLLQALAQAAGTEIAFSNGWRYGAPIAPGAVTLNDLWNIVPTNPRVSTVELTGAEMRQMLEENLERTFAADAYRQMGGYVKRMRGLKLYFKAENPSGRRIDRLFAGGKPVVDERAYRVGFIGAQGVPQKFGRNRRNLGIDAVGALRSLFHRAGTVRPAGEQTVYEI